VRGELVLATVVHKAVEDENVSGIWGLPRQSADFNTNNLFRCSLIYQLSADKFKDFFSCIMTGENSLKKNFNSNASYLALGIPLTTEILTEIICFGVQDENSNASYRIYIFGFFFEKLFFLNICVLLRPNECKK
jgi:hypothetical protein